MENILFISAVKLSFVYGRFSAEWTLFFGLMSFLPTLLRIFYGNIDQKEYIQPNTKPKTKIILDVKEYFMI